MASTPAPDSPDKLSLAGRGLWPLAALALLIALPLLLPPVLPLADLGGHLGRYAIQLDAGRDPQLAQWYTFRWLLIPNLGVSDATDGTLTLSMLVDTWRTEADEWGAMTDWSIDLIEA